MSDDPLDNMVFHALVGPQRELAEVAERDVAARFRPDVSPFCGLADASRSSWDGMASLLGEEEVAVLMGPRVEALPDDWECLLSEVATQWIAETLPAAPALALEPLGPADVPEMLALTALTEPGPFLEATCETGRYVGLRRGDALVAMAGERLRAGDWVEISAVCVHPTARRAGLGAALTLAVAETIRAEGGRPMLHVREGNEDAMALYRSLGFRLRTERFVYAVRPRDGAALRGD